MRQKGSSDLPKASRSWDWIPGRLASTSAFNLPTYFLIVFFLTYSLRFIEKLRKHRGFQNIPYPVSPVTDILR